MRHLTPLRLRALLSLLLAATLHLGACGGGATPATSTDAATTQDGGGDGQASPDTSAADTTAADAGAGDAQQLPDGSAPDANDPDAATTDDGGTAAGDASSPDASSPDASSGPKTTAWGDITGSCGAVAAELGKTTPSFLVNTFTFSPAAAFTPAGLSTGAKKRYDGGNAGGSSICSEVMSMQVLHECEGATLYKTETEIVYTRTSGAITDYETMIAGHKVGVSVTRAYKGPVINVYTEADASKLLKKKLAGVNESSAKISAADKWTKQVLHIWTLRADWVPTLKKVWDGLDASLKADTIVLVSVEVPPTGKSGWIVPDDCGL